MDVCKGPAGVADILFTGWLRTDRFIRPCHIEKTRVDLLLPIEPTSWLESAHHITNMVHNVK